MPASIKDQKLTRKSLLGKLKDIEDHQSWREFFDTYWKLIYSAALSAKLSPEEAEDVVQETVVCVSKAMPDFEYDRNQGSFKSWLLKITWRRINDQFRRKQREGRLINPHVDAHDELHPDPTIEDLWDKDWERNLMDAAIFALKDKIDPKHYQIFDLSVFKHWDAAKIAQTLNISRSKVYLTKHRVQTAVKNEINRLKEKHS